MGCLGGLAGPSGVLERPQGGLGVIWTDFTIRDLSGNYLGTIQELSGLGWLTQMGEDVYIQ